MSLKMALSKRNLSFSRMETGKVGRNSAVSSITPENAVAIAVATAAPLTPHPAPHIVKRRPSTATVRVGKIRRVLSTTLITLVAMLKTSGVRVSPAQRRMLEHTLMERLNR